MADKQKTSELPNMAFLEFLAEMEEVDGKLVSASDLQTFNEQATVKEGNASAQQLAILQMLQEAQPVAATQSQPNSAQKSPTTGAAEKSTTKNKEEDK